MVRRRQDELPAGAKPVHVRPKPTGPTATGRPRGRPTLAMLAQRSKEAKGAGPSENGIEIQPSVPNKVELQGEDEVEEMPPPKRVKRKHPDFRGMSRKEKLEALGMDENWTEYNALLMNKPTPRYLCHPPRPKKTCRKSSWPPETESDRSFQISTVVIVYLVYQGRARFRQRKRHGPCYTNPWAILCTQ